MPSKHLTIFWSQVLGYGLAGLIGALLSVASMQMRSSSKWDSPQSSAQRPRITVQEGDFVAATVQQVGPAVVRIDTERTIWLPPNPTLNDPFLRRFFGLEPPSPQQELQRGLGSGFIIDRSGILLTNAHVVKRADKVTVTLTDGRVFSGAVRGTDELMDLAVVRINPNGQDLPVVPLGDSEQVQMGDWAIAVGNPLGLDNTVTLGIVSNLNRSSNEIGILDKRLNFIQTDAAINPGNSGGPLLNKVGEVIGINTAIQAQSQGIGFAIPINTVKAVQQMLVEGKSIPHPFLGIHMASLTPELARENNRQSNTSLRLPEVKGVLVIQVLPNTPAAANLRTGDVIIEVKGQMITSAEKLQQVIDKSQVGQVLQLKVRRENKTVSLSVRIGNLADTD